jgi:hypothetical protein
MLFCGIGPRPPRTGSRTGRANRLIAPPRVYLRRGRRLNCALPPSPSPDAHDLVPVGVRAAHRVAHLDDFLVGHEGLGPVHRAEPDAEQGQAHADPEQRRAAGSCRRCPAGRPWCGCRRGSRPARRTTVPRIDRPNRPATCFSATLGRGLAEIGSARHVRGQAGVLETVGDAALTDDVTLVETDGVLAESLGGGDVLVVHRLIDPVDVRWMWASVTSVMRPSFRARPRSRPRGPGRRSRRTCPRSQDPGDRARDRRGCHPPPRS